MQDHDRREVAEMLAYLRAIGKPDLEMEREFCRREAIMTWKGIVGKPFFAEEFAAYVDGVEMGLWRPQFVVLHNTSEPKLSEWHSVPGEQRMRNLEAYYRDTQHWSAGPHLFVADDLIWTFTPLNTAGVHSPSWNHISWGVEMVGDYDSETFGDEVRKNVIAALVALHRKLGLNPNTLRLHREDPLTTHRDCPGKNVSKLEIIAALETALASPAVNA
jgi:hypothetical protein